MLCFPILFLSFIYELFTASEKPFYNVAFIIREWREIAGTYKQIGYVIRDMQIIIEETENEKRQLC